MTNLEQRYRKAEGQCFLYEVFTPQETRRYTATLIAIAAFIVGLGIGAFAAL